LMIFDDFLWFSVISDHLWAVAEPEKVLGGLSLQKIAHNVRFSYFYASFKTFWAQWATFVYQADMSFSSLKKDFYSLEVVIYHLEYHLKWDQPFFEKIIFLPKNACGGPQPKFSKNNFC
jgi:hypothetical protein